MVIVGFGKLIKEDKKTKYQIKKLPSQKWAYDDYGKINQALCQDTIIDSDIPLL